jgi:hypothetical protein
MARLRKALGGRRTDLVARRVGALKFGIKRLDLGVPPLQRVVFRVREARRIRLVIVPVRLTEPLRERRELLGRFLEAEFCDGARI